MSEFLLVRLAKGFGRRLSLWLRRVPLRDPVDRRNAPALQLLLMALGTEIPVNKVYHLFTAARIPMSSGQLTVDLATDAAMTLGAWTGVVLIRQGYLRQATSAFIAVVLSSAVAANIAFGYQLQAFDPYPMLVLTLSALVIGRRALWCVYLCIPVVFWIGMESPWGQNPDQHDSPLQNLPSLALSYLLIALVLDRTVAALRESLQQARQNAQQLRLEMRERARAQQRVLHLQKIESVGNLASGVSHDFNNILSAIIGYTAQRHRVFELDYEPNRDALAMAEALEGIELAAQRGSAVSSKLLAFSRKDLFKPEQVELGKTLQDLQPMLRQLLGATIVVSLDLPRDPVVVYLDRSQFELAILNFGANARDALPQGGHFSIELRQEDHRVRLTLSDDGLGMGQAVQQQIFEPFFTTKPPGQGTGLGLAVAMEMVQQAQGTLSVSSTVGEGTSFVLDLPGVKVSSLR